MIQTMISRAVRLHSIWAVSLAAVLAACDQPPETAPGIDIQTETEALLARDYEFAALAEEVGVAEAYRQVMAADAIQLPDGGVAIGGRDAIYAELRELTDGVEFSLTWEPLEAMVAASGELGFTWGVYYYEALDEMGAPFVAEGKYVYLWRKQAGRWELILDITNETDSVYSGYGAPAGMPDELPDDMLDEIPEELIPE